jgi:hypothetical protein
LLFLAVAEKCPTAISGQQLLAELQEGAEISVRSGVAVRTKYGNLKIVQSWKEQSSHPSLIGSIFQ